MTRKYQGADTGNPMKIWLAVLNFRRILRYRPQKKQESQ